MKLGNIVNMQFQIAFKKLAAQTVSMRAAFVIKNIEKQIKDEIGKYDSARLDALKRLGTVKEDGNLEVDENGNAKLSEENMKQFSEELRSLSDLDVTISSIKINDLGSDVKLSATEVSLLEDIVVE